MRWGEAPIKGLCEGSGPQAARGEAVEAPPLLRPVALPVQQGAGHREVPLGTGQLSCDAGDTRHAGCGML